MHGKQEHTDDLTDDDIARQDQVDNAIFELVQQLAPANADKIEWQLEWIGEIRDIVQHVIVDIHQCCDEFEWTEQCCQSERSKFRCDCADQFEHNSFVEFDNS